MPSAGGAGGKLGEEAGLADARLPDDEDEPARVARGRQVTVELAQRGLATHQRPRRKRIGERLRTLPPLPLCLFPARYDQPFLPPPNAAGLRRYVRMRTSRKHPKDPLTDAAVQAGRCTGRQRVTCTVHAGVVEPPRTLSPSKRDWIFQSPPTSGAKVSENPPFPSVWTVCSTNVVSGRV